MTEVTQADRVLETCANPANLSDADAVLAALKASGRVIVPVEPTDGR